MLALDSNARERVALLIRSGNTVEVAAQAVGMSRATLYRRLASDQALREAVDLARVDAESDLVVRVSRAARRGSWRAALWLLERRWPERWAPALDRPKCSA